MEKVKLNDVVNKYLGVKGIEIYDANNKLVGAIPEDCKCKVNNKYKDLLCTYKEVYNTIQIDLEERIEFERRG